jgi:hypothetical protein
MAPGLPAVWGVVAQLFGSRINREPLRNSLQAFVDAGEGFGPVLSPSA